MPFAANLSDDTDPGSGSPATVTDVRVGSHDGFDRVVFDTGGGGVPGWRVGYVDQPAAQGSGNAIQITGDAVLEVTLTNTGLPFDTGSTEFSGSPVNGADVVTEVVYTGIFEGQTQAFIGLTSQRPFRVYALNDGRVVVEIWQEGVGA